jgi:hypothetical protein
MADTSDDPPTDSPRVEDPKPLRTSVEGVVFLHKEIWRVVELQLTAAEAAVSGSFYHDLVAMVFTSHALEGYLNFVGERLAPEYWKKERRHFRFTGFAGKAGKIFELCGLPEPEKGRPPYSSVWLLKDFRDQIGHAKPISFEIERDHGHEDHPDFTGYNPLMERVNHANALQCADDTREIVTMIHRAAKTQVPHDIWFGESGLGGNISHRSHFTRARPISTEM